MLSLQPTLQEWTEPEIKSIIQHSRLREYPPNSVLLASTLPKFRFFKFSFHSEIIVL